MRQPRALTLLLFVQMWECFSFYGMRALLVLYMIDALSFSQPAAFGVYAAYTSMVEMFVLLGGVLADKVWGLRASIYLGGALIALGHLSLAFSQFFFLGLALIIVGSSLFKTNLKALLGAFYEREDPRCESGFTLFYSGMNLGGFLAVLLCGYVGHFYGWHAGFGLAAIGMVAGLALLVCKRSLLENKGYAARPRPLWIKGGALMFVLGLVPLCICILQQTHLALFTLPFIGIGAILYLFFQLKSLSVEQKKSVYLLLGMIFLLMVYFSFEELMGSLLMVFSDHFVSKTIFGFEVPTSVLLIMNPLTVILTGSLIAKIHLHVSKKLTFSWACLAAAFFLLTVGCVAAPVSPFFLLGSFSLIALGELLIAPTVYAYAAQFAPPQLKGILMSLVTLGFAYGSLISGTLSQQMNLQTISEYSSFFLSITLAAVAIVFVFFLKKGLSAASKSG